MSASLGLVAAGAASSAAGSMLAPSGYNVDAENADYVNNTIGRMNGTLNTALVNALNYSTQQTNNAVLQQNTSLNQATTANNQGLSQNVALNSPAMLAGDNALDSYQASLGLSTPTGGNAALQNNLFQTATLQPQIQNVENTAAAANAAGMNITNPFATPSAATSSLNGSVLGMNATQNQDTANWQNAWQGLYGAAGNAGLFSQPGSTAGTN